MSASGWFNTFAIALRKSLSRHNIYYESLKFNNHLHAIHRLGIDADEAICMQALFFRLPYLQYMILKFLCFFNLRNVPRRLLATIYIVFR